MGSSLPPRESESPSRVLAAALASLTFSSQSADGALRAVLVLAAVTDALEMNEHLARALDSRAVIEQAKGIIIATTHCTPDHAFDLLRQQSQSENRKLREIAEEIVERNVV